MTARQCRVNLEFIDFQSNSLFIPQFHLQLSRKMLTGEHCAVGAVFPASSTFSHNCSCKLVGCSRWFTQMPDVEADIHSYLASMFPNWSSTWVCSTHHHYAVSHIKHNGKQTHCRVQDLCDTLRMHAPATFPHAHLCPHQALSSCPNLKWQSG